MNSSRDLALVIVGIKLEPLSSGSQRDGEVLSLRYVLRLTHAKLSGAGLLTVQSPNLTGGSH